MSIHLLNGHAPQQDTRMREGDVQISNDGDRVIMRQCVVISSVFIPEQAMAFVQGLGQAAQHAAAFREAAMNPGGIVQVGGEGSGLIQR